MRAQFPTMPSSRATPNIMSHDGNASVSPTGHVAHPTPPHTCADVDRSDECHLQRSTSGGGGGGLFTRVRRRVAACLGGPRLPRSYAFNTRFSQDAVGHWLATLGGMPQRDDGHAYSGGGDDGTVAEHSSAGGSVTVTHDIDHLCQHRCTSATLTRVFPGSGMCYTEAVGRFAAAQLSRQRASLESNTRKISDRDVAAKVIDDHLEALTVSE
jgi:hypothetical protein